MSTTTTAAPGTCKLQGCPGWGTRDEHAPSVHIGSGTWEDYTRVDHCLGFPVVINFVHQLTAVCSIGRNDAWVAYNVGSEVTPALMAQLVDQHKTGCTNRSTRG